MKKLKKALKKRIKNLSLNDFDFVIEKGIGTIKPKKVEAFETIKKIDNTVEYKIFLPDVDFNFCGKIIRPEYFILSDKEKFNEFIKENYEHTFLEVEVIYMQAQIKNLDLLKSIDSYRKWNRGTFNFYSVYDKYAYVKYNLPPFIINQEITEAYKNILFEEIKKYLLFYI